MNKTGINSDNITTNERLTRENVSSFYVANYGNTDMIVTINDVPETIPAYDTVNRFARSIQFADGQGFFDLKMSIDFVGGSGKAVFRYTQYQPPIC